MDSFLAVSIAVIELESTVAPVAVASTAGSGAGGFVPVVDAGWFPEESAPL